MLPEILQNQDSVVILSGESTQASFPSDRICYLVLRRFKKWVLVTFIRKNVKVRV